MEKYLSPAEVCEVVPGMSESRLKRHRFEGTGPRYIKLSPRRVAYAATSVDEWLKSREIGRTDEPVPA